MDPFSITVGVVGLTTFVLHSARRVNEFVDGIQGAPDAINILSRDLHAFAHVLESLSTMLTEPAFRQLPARKQIELRLEEPLNNCVDTLERIREGIKPFVKTSGVARKSKWRGFIWTFNEKEILTLRETLMHYKSTLEIAISIANLSNSTSSFHQISAQIGVIQRRIGEDGDSVIDATEGSSIAGTDVGFAMRRWILDPTTDSAESPNMDWQVVATDFRESDDPIETKSVDQKRESTKGDMQAETIAKASIDIAEDTKRLDTTRQDALRASALATSHRLHIIPQNHIEEAKYSEIQDAIIEGHRRGLLDISSSSGRESVGASNQGEAAVRLRMERLPEMLDETREEPKTRGEEFYLETAVTASDAQYNPFHKTRRLARKNRVELERGEPSIMPQNYRTDKLSKGVEGGASTSDSSMNPDDLASQSVRLKEEQLRREEEKLREIGVKVRREINEKRQEIETEVRREQSTSINSQDARSNLSYQAITFSDALRDDRNAHPASSSQYRDPEEAARQRVLDDLVLMNEEHAEYGNDHSNLRRVMPETNDKDQEDSQSPIPGQTFHRAIDSLVREIEVIADTLILKRLEYQTLGDSEFWDLIDKTLSCSSEVVCRLRNIKRDAQIGGSVEYFAITKLERVVKSMLNHQQRICRDRRRQAQPKFQEQYRVIRPEASEAEVLEAFEDTSRKQIFSQALLQGLQGDALQVAQKIQLQHEDILRIEQTMVTLAQLSQDLDELEPITSRSSALPVDQDEPRPTANDHLESYRMANDQLDGAIKSARKARALKNRFLTLGVSRLFERDD